ncbi:MAG: ABC transporter ATP-binding protein [Armatimonadetes bacterium]|nr:ABC transporter ATP-binding protein [Armatimonadota bacterium]
MLRLEKIVVNYGDTCALWDVSLHVEQHECVALVGANGAGKSTTLRAVSGLLGLHAGRITFMGEDLRDVPAHKRVDMGLVHVPEGRGVFPLLTVRENLLVGSYLPRARAARAENLERAFHLFARLREREGQLAGTLSGGEQQMLAIARGLMSGPRLLMLDEPSLGLAPLVTQEIFRVIREVHASGVPVLLVEQNVKASLEAAQRGYVLENGRTTLQGKSADLLADPAVREAYLGLS